MKVGKQSDIAAYLQGREVFQSICCSRKRRCVCNEKDGEAAKAGSTRSHAGMTLVENGSSTCILLAAPILLPLPGTAFDVCYDPNAGL